MLRNCYRSLPFGCRNFRLKNWNARVLHAKRDRDGDGEESESGYWTLSKSHYYELEVKKSKFLATAWPVDSPKEALSLVVSASDPGASHNCFAYKIGPEYRSTDDGEPGGTAGRPMLAAIEGEGLDHVCVLVIRYFGGTKLGTGGLVRAYGGAARSCLKEAERIFVKAKVVFKLKIGYDLMGPVYGVLEKHKATRLQENFDENGLMEIEASTEESVFQKLSDEIQNASSGRVTVERLK